MRLSRREPTSSWHITFFMFCSYVLTPAQPNGGIKICVCLRMPEIYEERWAFTLDVAIKHTVPPFSELLQKFTKSAITFFHAHSVPGRHSSNYGGYST